MFHSFEIDAQLDAAEDSSDESVATVECSDNASRARVRARAS